MRLHHESRGNSCKLMQASVCQRKNVCTLISTCIFYQRDFCDVVCTPVAIAVEKHSDLSEGRREKSSYLLTMFTRFFCSVFRYVQKLSQIYCSRESQDKTTSKRATSKARWWDAKIPTKLKHIAKKTTWMFLWRQPLSTLRNTQRR